MWEYKKISFKYLLVQELIDELNKCGDENWELIHYQESKTNIWCNETDVKALFKRKKIRHVLYEKSKDGLR